MCLMRHACSSLSPLTPSGTGWGDVSTSPPAKDTFELRLEDIALIQEETWEVRYKWRYLGNALKMPRLVLDMIEEEYDYTREYYREVVRRWLRMTEPKPTWQALVTALRDVEEQPLARYLRRSFTVGEYTVYMCGHCFSACVWCGWVCVCIHLLFQQDCQSLVSYGGIYVKHRWTH